jgi:hypothetical protein
MDGESAHVPPKLTVFRPEERDAVVSIVACDTYDFGRGVWRGAEPDPDMLISADGHSGRLAQVLSAGGPAAFHTHWQTMFSQGRSVGRDALAAVARRVRERFGDRVEWMRTMDVATYTAAAAALHIEPDRAASDSVEDIHRIPLRLTTAFESRRFTMSFIAGPHLQTVRIDGRPLARVASSEALGEGTFLVAGDRVYICWPIQSSQQLQLELN